MCLFYKRIIFSILFYLTWQNLGIQTSKNKDLGLKNAKNLKNSVSDDFSPITLDLVVQI